MRTRFAVTTTLLAASIVAIWACRAEDPAAEAEVAYQGLVDDYLEAWTDFHPTRAAALGLHEKPARAETRQMDAVETWVALNERVLDSLARGPDQLSVDLRIDLRLLESEIRSEIRAWRDEAPLRNSTRDGTEDAILGRDRYARELQLYYGMEITPEEVGTRALGEMETVRNLIAQVSRDYWEETYPRDPVPRVIPELVSRVSADMEKNRSSSEADALEAFTRFAWEAEAFVAEKEIATLPADRTLEIRLTPESAGPFQRIGFVDSPPPFEPDPMTVLSIPTIPDTFPPQEKEDFYRSFNNHFNKFIIIHELFPGHYMQLKIASGNPRRVRSFFPYEPYIEGWATLVETLALDAGWDEYNKLTYLAHLRKRLENANRAYTSVQVHCNGWDEPRVREFSREKALLAPQFAESLWGRLLRSPMQMTSYFMGKEMFMKVLEEERARMGEDFDLKHFNDVILRAGAVPLDMIPELLADSRKETGR